MYTAGKIVDLALKDLIAQGVNLTMDAKNVAECIDVLNLMMLDFDANNITLGYTVVTTPSQELTVPDGALFGIQKNLSYAICTRYGKPCPPEIVDLARKGKNTLRKLGGSIPSMYYPSTMPIGTGNNRDNDRDYRFYPGPPEEVLAETTGPINLEDGTEGSSP